MIARVGAIRDGVTQLQPIDAPDGATGESSLCLAVPTLASAARSITNLPDQVR